MRSSRTKLPYPVHIEGPDPEARYWCYLDHPPEILNRRMVERALREFGANSVDAALRSLTARLPRHSYTDILLKLGAINSLANTNTRKLSDVAAAMKSWESTRSARLSKLIRSGSPERAMDLMSFVSKKAETASSLLSKYLAYHNERWMIYDSYVRCYTYAMLRGELSRHSEQDDARLAADPPPVKNARQLKDYDKYCQTVEWLWRRLPIEAPATARKREAVFWFRAKHCRVIDPVRIRNNKAR